MNAPVIFLTLIQSPKLFQNKIFVLIKVYVARMLCQVCHLNILIILNCTENFPKNKTFLWSKLLNNAVETSSPLFTFYVTLLIQDIAAPIQTEGRTHFFLELHNLFFWNFEHKISRGFTCNDPLCNFSPIWLKSIFSFRKIFDRI